jgi:hypothetical protein
MVRLAGERSLVVIVCSSSSFAVVLIDFLPDVIQLDRRFASVLRHFVSVFYGRVWCFKSELDCDYCVWRVFARAESFVQPKEIRRKYLLVFLFYRNGNWADISYFLTSRVAGAGVMETGRVTTHEFNSHGSWCTSSFSFIYKISNKKLFCILFCTHCTTKS